MSIDLQHAYIEKRISSIINHLKHDRLDMSYTKTDKEIIDLDIKFMELLKKYHREEWVNESNLH